MRVSSSLALVLLLGTTVQAAFAESTCQEEQGTELANSQVLSGLGKVRVMHDGFLVINKGEVRRVWYTAPEKAGDSGKWCAQRSARMQDHVTCYGDSGGLQTDFGLISFNGPSASYIEFQSGELVMDRGWENREMQRRDITFLTFEYQREGAPNNMGQRFHQIRATGKSNGRSLGSHVERIDELAKSKATQLPTAYMDPNLPTSLITLNSGTQTIKTGLCSKPTQLTGAGAAAVSRGAGEGR